MGREWYSYLSPAKSNKGGVGGGGRRRSDGGYGGDGSGGRDSSVGCGGASPTAAAAAGHGCMSTLLHLLDFHRFQSCLQHHPHAFPSPDPLLADDHPNISLRGVEAPRNSLDSEEIFKGTASLASIDQEAFDTCPIPMGIYINTGSRRDKMLRLLVPSNSRLSRSGCRGEGGDELSSSESNSSPGPRTPNLVARLMGLDVLPDGISTPNNATPRSSSSLIPPRRRQPSSSFSRPRSPDVYGHRLSLQIQKENRLTAIGELDLPRQSCSAITTKRRDNWSSADGRCFHGSRSPGSYARQAKEDVLGMKFGVDITNVRDEMRERRRDEHLMMTSLRTRKKTVTESIPSEDSGPAEPKPYNGGRLTKQIQGKVRAKKVIAMKKDELFVRRGSSPEAAAGRRCRSVDKMMSKEGKRSVLLSAGGDGVGAPAAKPSSSGEIFRASSSCSKKLESPWSAYTAPPQQRRQQTLQLEAQAAAAEGTVAAGPAETQWNSHNCNPAIPRTVVTTSHTTSTGTNADFKYITNMVSRSNHNIGIHSKAPAVSSPANSSAPSVFHDIESLYLSSNDDQPAHCPRLQLDRRMCFDVQPVDALKPFEEIGELIALEIEYDMVDLLLRELAN